MIMWYIVMKSTFAARSRGLAISLSPACTSDSSKSLMNGSVSCSRTRVRRSVMPSPSKSNTSR